MLDWKKLLLIISISMILFVSVAAYTLDRTNPFHLEDHPSPSDWIQENQIKVDKDKVVLNIPNTIWAKFTNTNSMDPFIDENSHALEILPEIPEQINEGDIISYKSSYGIVIHRVIEKNIDEGGIYYITKGDNSPFRDTMNVRFRDVRGVVVAVLY